MHHYVDRAVEAQNLQGVERVGIDETSSRRGTSTCRCSPISTSGVACSCVEGRDHETVQAFSLFLETHGGDPGQVSEVCQDMSEAFLKGTLTHLPKAEITFDRYHVKSHLSKAVDEVRREESKHHRELLANTRYMWLKRPANLTERQRDLLDELLAQPLADRPRVHARPAVRQLLRDRRSRHRRGVPAPLDHRGRRRPTSNRCTSSPRMLEDHWLGVIRWHHSRVSNGLLEGLNSLIQAAKRRARGYRSNRNFIAMIYLINFDREFVRRWVNWRTYMAHHAPDNEPTFENFIGALKDEYTQYTPRYAESESGVPAETIVQVAREAARARPAFASHIWRAAAAGNLHGWLVTRAVMLLNVLTGCVGARGGVSPNTSNKFIPEPWRKPPANTQWNELSWPRAYPLAHNELSVLYPHFLHDGATQPVLFTRVLNPIWTYPDGYSWLRALRDENRVALHAALTPTWSETAWWSDYVLPMGHGPERHDTHSYETHAGRWLGFRQPVRRVAMERMGEKVQFTYEANPGEVWEEGEFWIELSWRTDPDGSLGIRQYYESPYRPGEKITLEEYYRWMFEHSVPGLRRRRQRKSSPLSSTCAATAWWRSHARSITSTTRRSRNWTTPRSAVASKPSPRSHTTAHTSP